MVRHFSFCIGLLIILTSCRWTNCSAAALLLEDKFRELELRLETTEARSVQVEEKVSQLEAQLELNNEIRNNLKFQVTKLEAKNVQLEFKIQEQEKLLNYLLRQTNRPVPVADSLSVPNNLKSPVQSTDSNKSGTPRTCKELRVIDPSLPSGMYSIDPDGQGVGENPIYVYCDMTSGSTSILHDSESAINVGHCADPGCYSRSIKYNASIGQIKALAELSFECHQSIKYDCYYAPFELSGYAYSWWNDRDGNAQYFWAGDNTEGIHTCQCGIDGNCVDNYAKCNCDAAVYAQLFDDGVITNKNVLPVTRLNFGRTQLPTSSGIHTLGRFECTGTVALTRMPTSCEDLWLVGHILNGFYSVMGSAMMESVYCDFTKLPGNDGFQKWIGYADVKSVPVHFYVQRTSNFNTTNIPIPFDLALVNKGNAMDLTSGIFTAPRQGTYYFSFTGLAQFSASSYTLALQVALNLNGGIIGKGHVDMSSTATTRWNQLTLQSTLSLKSGDQVWVDITSASSGVALHDNGNHYTHFTGFVLEEDIVASL
ncbi:uncharacterized protein LOC124205831 [Daphnia pulex]|uniref:uncharacterized protein LOC124205831 n=1 Tax=Daphnia pulex TaxID=6669 RepID=UPI001EDE9384|nr:uncharacterized protein LOC124205831 [Daphnia pulex]